MHLTNTFKDELTFYLKQYTLCYIIVILAPNAQKRNPLQIANVLLFEHFMLLYTISSFYTRYFNKQ